MSQHTFYWIDAFTDKRFGGNPCAVVLDADDLSSQQMQVIAKEMNLSETAFTLGSKSADFGARFFTPEGELPFAGHPTLSTIHSLLCEGLIPVNQSARVTLEVPAGVIPIEIFLESGRTKISISQLAPEFLRSYESEEILDIFGLSSDDLLPGAPIQTVSTGTPILMVPLKNHNCLRKAKFADADAYSRLVRRGDFMFPHFFCLEGVSLNAQTFARSPGIPPSGLEDPFTGSATGCMAAYLWRYGLIKRAKFVAEQGHWMGRPGSAEVEVVGSSTDIKTVRLTGEAITVIRGVINC